MIKNSIKFKKEKQEEFNGKATWKLKKKQTKNKKLKNDKKNSISLKKKSKKSLM